MNATTFQEHRESVEAPSPATPKSYYTRVNGWTIYFRFLAFADMGHGLRSERWQVEATDCDDIDDESYPRGIAFVRHMTSDALAASDGGWATWTTRQPHPAGMTRLGYLFAVDRRCGIATALVDAITARWPNVEWGGATPEGEAFEEAYREARGANRLAV